MSTDNNQSIAIIPNMNLIPFVYKGSTFLFSPTKCINPSGRDKKVFFGRFAQEHNNNYISLPEGIEFDKEYCLKTVFLTFSSNEYLLPPDRHFWDFYPFKGDNLREVIAMNDDAQTLSEVLSVTSHRDLKAKLATFSSLSCAIIEPIYSQLDINDFKTPLEKIDCLLQIVSGLKQLFGHSVLANHKIVAHRDLKFGNTVVEKLSDGSKRIRLIDFPSVKTQEPKNTPSANHTQLGFFSYSNTAPEDVLRRYNISEKTDVFALGTMLTEIFKVWDFGEICNPLTLLFDCKKDLIVTNWKNCSEFYDMLDRNFKNRTNPDELGWLEIMLDTNNKNAHWNQINQINPSLCKLFRKATNINPKERCSLDEFEKSLLISKNDVITNKVFADHSVSKKISYFLIDTLNIDEHKNTYVKTVKQIAQITPNTNAAVLTFGWRHKINRMNSDPGALAMNPLAIDDVCCLIARLEPTSRENSYASEIKGCLFELSEYLKNQSNYNTFNGEIHIFTPEMPHKDNSCFFEDYIKDEFGTIKTIYLTNEEICKRFDKSVKIYVHAYKLSGKLEDASWYTPVPFKEDVTTVKETVSTTVLEESPKTIETESTVTKLVPGSGFSFLRKYF